MRELPKDFSNFLEAVASEYGIPDFELEALRRALDGETANKISQELGITDNAVRKRMGSVYARFKITGSVLGKLEKLKEVLLEHYNARQLQGVEEDKDDVPFISNFKGYKDELGRLELEANQFQLIAILGQGGMGKSSLAAEFIKETKRRWDRIIWCSLVTAPPIIETIQYLIREISGESKKITNNERDKEALLNAAIRELVVQLKSKPSLIVIDNLESILTSGAENTPGYYIEGYQRYEDLFRLVAESSHQSCLILTSREKPRDIEVLEMKSKKILVITLKGLKGEDAEELFRESISPEYSDNSLNMSEDDKKLEKKYTKEIIEDVCDCNPFSVQILAAYISENYGGDVKCYRESNDEKLIFGSNIFFDILADQIERLSYVEKTIIYWLAIERESVSSSDLEANIISLIPESEVFAALKNLERRYLIRHTNNRFCLQPLVLEFLTNELIAKNYQSIIENSKEDKKEEGKDKSYSNPDLDLPNSHALILINPRIKEHVIEAQERLILKPLSTKLIGCWGRKKTAENLTKLIDKFKKNPFEIPGYFYGNISHLLICIEGKLSGDFSGLNFKSLSIKDVAIDKANFTDATIDRNGFTYTVEMDSILSIAFARNGKKFATGGADNKVCVWDYNSKKKSIFRSSKEYDNHSNWVRAVEFSPNGKTLASCGDDCTIKLWNVETEKCCFSVEEHTNWVSSIAFHPTKDILASGSQDGRIKFWKIKYNDNNNNPTLVYLREIVTHRRIWSVAFSPNGEYLVSGSDDPKISVQLWNVNTYDQIENFLQNKELNSRIFKVVFHRHKSDNHTLLAAAGENGKVYLWRCNPSKPNFEEIITPDPKSSVPIRSLCFNDEGNILATASDNGKIGLLSQTEEKWDNYLDNRNTSNAEDINLAWSVAFRPMNDSKDLELFSSGDDRTLKLWRVVGKERKSIVCDWEIQGYSRAKWCVAFSPNSKIIASGTDEYSIELWDVNNGQPIDDCIGHTGRVWSVAFHPQDNNILCSGSDDGTIKLWYTKTCQCLKNLEKPKVSSYKNQVWSVVFHPMGKIIASGGEDRIVSLWDVEEECFITSFTEEHEGLIWNVVFSPDGQTLASGSDDGTIKLWKIDTDVDGNYVKHNFLEILCRPPELTKSRIWSVAFSPDGRTLASANHDGQIDFWEESNGKYEYKSEKNLKHDSNKKRVWSVAFSDNNTLVSSGDDGLVKLWDLNTRQSESIMSHSDWACAVAFNSQVTHIASCSKDSTIKIFDIKSKQIKSLEKPKLYDGLNITNISGLEKAQIDDLTKLGAQYDDK